MIYLVTGFMRSGTSMMMECLEAGGISIAKSESRDKFNESRSDNLYTPNHKGLYELDDKIVFSYGFPKQFDGQAVKLLLQGLPCLAVHEYMVIFMRRNSEEIRQSFEGAFKGKTTVERIEQGVTNRLERLRNRKDVKSVYEVWYRAFLSDPLFHLEEMKCLGWPIDVAKAVTIPDAALCRFRIEKLTVGI
ncbi:MAG: hypothetical protein KKC77_19205 [Proteobacteria bacterium]|nr:hypothetical protein [Pseudomonadota bacterium]